MKTCNNMDTYSKGNPFPFFSNILFKSRSTGSGMRRTNFLTNRYRKWRQVKLFRWNTLILQQKVELMS
ncbi:hypothetical protein HW555_003628 [Spodoptera exigua]|uniref:Uncharacterized protein n=1 Tax=Spodoptera exigua TaxID=7107 RepID=A0A835GL48_SPOEX|nr:hypothetical protein HW555_003628 [Spodoptera exigua]